MVNSGFAKNKPERVEKGWEMVQRNVERIRSMVLDILYYAKDRELAVEDVDLGMIVADIREGMEKKASDADTGLEISVAEDAGALPGDPQAIRAMLINLIENLPNSSYCLLRMDKDRDVQLVDDVCGNHFDGVDGIVLGKELDAPAATLVAAINKFLSI